MTKSKHKLGKLISTVELSAQDKRTKNGSKYRTSGNKCRGRGSNLLSLGFGRDIGYPKTTNLHLHISGQSFLKTSDYLSHVNIR